MLVDIRHYTNPQYAEKLLDEVSLAENLLETRHGGNNAEAVVTYQSYTVDNPTDNDQQARLFYCDTFQISSSRRSSVRYRTTTIRHRILGKQSSVFVLIIFRFTFLLLPEHSTAVVYQSASGGDLMLLVPTTTAIRTKKRLVAGRTSTETAADTRRRW